MCHCTICQAVYKRPYADVVALWASDVSLPEGHGIAFRKYRLPPALNRGTCRSCGAPVVGFLTLAPFLRLAFIPSRNFPASTDFPKPGLHLFYNRRIADVADDLPKYSGYLRSEWAATRYILATLMRGEARHGESGAP